MLNTCSDDFNCSEWLMVEVRSQSVVTLSPSRSFWMTLVTGAASRVRPRYNVPSGVSSTMLGGLPLTRIHPQKGFHSARVAHRKLLSRRCGANEDQPIHGTQEGGEQVMTLHPCLRQKMQLRQLVLPIPLHSPGFVPFGVIFCEHSIRIYPALHGRLGNQKVSGRLCSPLS